MSFLLLALRLFTDTLPPSDPALGRWAARVESCLASGEAEVLAADAAGLLAFACGKDSRRLVVMANASSVPQRVRRTDAGPLVPVFALNADVAEVPSLLVTLFESGGVVYANEVPAGAVVVFRPAEPEDVRPGGLDE